MKPHSLIRLLLPLSIGLLLAATTLVKLGRPTKLAEASAAPPAARPGNNQAASSLTSQVTGRVTANGFPLADVTIWASGGISTATQANGDYIFTGLVTGTYVLTPTLAGRTFIPLTRTVDLPPDALGQDFFLIPARLYLPLVHKPLDTFSLAGRVTDPIGAPIAGVTLSSGVGPPAITDANGLYLFSGLPRGSYVITPLLTGYLFSPSQHLVDVPPAQANLDFTGSAFNIAVTRLRVLQATQTEANDAPLVQDRPAVAVAKISISPGDPIDHRQIGVTLTALRDGVPLPGAVGLQPEDESAPDSEEYGGLLPTAWLSAEITLIATADPGDAYIEINEDDNLWQASFAFNPVPVLDVMLVPVNYTHTPTGQRFPAALIDTISSYTLDVYPINAMQVAYHAPVEFAGNLSDPAELSRLLNLMLDIKEADNAPDSRIYYGWIPYASRAWNPAMGGLGFLGLRAAIGLGYDYPSAGLLFAHEAGHNLGLRHTGCEPYAPEADYPYAHGSIGQWGLQVARWPEALAWKDPADYVDLMSYCTGDGWWISDYVYTRLYQDQRARGWLPAHVETTDSLLIRARFDERGRATLLPVYALDSTPSEPPPQSDYVIELRSEDGELIAAHRVAPGEIADLPGGGGLSLAVTVPRPGQPVASVQLVKGEQALAARALGQPLHLVTVPEIERRPEAWLIRWEANDSPTLVRFTLDGQTWMTVGLDVTGGSIQIAPAFWPGEKARFEVIIGK